MAELQVINGGKSGNSIGSKAWAGDIRVRAKDLAENLGSGYMELAKILYYVFDTPVDGDPKNPPVYTLWGYDSFAEYAEQELGLQRRKAERLRAIWYRLEVELANMPKDLKQRIINLGWSKVRELCQPGVLTLRNAPEWVKAAEMCNYTELCKTVQNYRKELEKINAQKALGLDSEGDVLAPKHIASSIELGDGAAVVDVEDLPVPEVEKVSPLTIQVTAAQKLNILEALTQAATLTEHGNRAENLDMICLDFIATNDFLSKGVEQKLRYLTKMEKLLGLKLVAIDAGTNQIVHGLDTLESLAKEAEDDSDHETAVGE